MKLKQKQHQLDRLTKFLDSAKISYAKAQVEATDKTTGAIVYMTVIQNAFVFDRMTGKYLFTHWLGLLKPSETPQPKIENQ